MNDTQLVEHLMAKLDTETREDLQYWVENFSEGYECDHYYGMVRGKVAYRVETEEEKQEKRRKLQEHNRRMRSRWKSGDCGLDMLMWKMTDSYTQHLTDAVFAAKPLLFQLTEDNKEQTRTEFDWKQYYASVPLPGKESSDGQGDT